MKKTWTKPEAGVQLFVANEYVAACWGVTCDVPEKAGMTGSQGAPDDFPQNATTHRAAFCGDPTHYQIALDENGTPTDMIEIKTDNLGDLPCTVYTDDTYGTRRDISTINSGDYIYWTTKADSRTWHHHGTVTGVYNHS